LPEGRQGAESDLSGRPTLYEVAGGDGALLALAQAHHARCLADPELNHPFTHGDLHPQHVERLATYWAEVLGGPKTFSETCGDQTHVLGLHCGNGAMSDLPARFSTACVPAPDAPGLPAAPESRAAIRAYMRGPVDNVMASSAAGRPAPAGLPMPHWGWDGLENSA